MATEKADFMTHFSKTSVIKDKVVSVIIE